jgi:hypothetical protein
MEHSPFSPVEIEQALKIGHINSAVGACDDIKTAIMSIILLRTEIAEKRQSLSTAVHAAKKGEDKEKQSIIKHSHNIACK